MQDDFLLMNGDTLYEDAVLGQLLDSTRAPITLVVNSKDEYDEDDMKVSIMETGRLQAVSKILDKSVVNGESIGLMRFTGDGVTAFRAALDKAVRTSHGIKAYYLSVIDQLSREIVVETSSMTGLWWGEMDSPEDLESVRAAFIERNAAANTANTAENVKDGGGGRVDEPGGRGESGEWSSRGKSRSPATPSTVDS
jgi:choline kinase